jgi:hypothetical protein
MFKYYFQSGEFQPDQGSFLKDIGLPLLAIIITMFIFLGQILHEARKARQDKEQKDVDRLMFLLHLINGSINFSKTLINSCDKLIADVKATPYQIGTLDLISADDLIRSVERINHEEMFHAYKNIIKSDNIASIFTSVDSLNRIRLNILDLWIEFRKADHLFKADISQMMGKIIESTANLVKNPEVDTSIIAILEEIQFSLERIPEEKKGNYKHLNDEYFSKIDSFIQSSNLPYLTEMSQYTFKGMLSIALLIKSNNQFAEKLILANESGKSYFAHLQKNSTSSQNYYESLP